MFLVLILFHNFNAKDNNSLIQSAIKSVVLIKCSTDSDQITLLDLGSGVVISKDGYIISNLHVIKNQRQIFVENFNNEIFEAIVVGFDNRSDIVIMKLKEFSDIRPAKFGNDSIEVGSKVFAVGNPYGLGITVTEGIISGNRSDIGNPYLDLIQTDAAVNPGNSGGALINTSGELIGMISKIYSVDGTFSGISFALPIDTITKISSQIIKFGSAKKAWIGNFKVIQRKVFINSEISPCLEIIDLASGPLKDNFGVKNSDCIFKINSKKATWDNLNQTLQNAFPGNLIELVVIDKAGNFKTIEIKTGSI